VAGGYARIFYHTYIHTFIFKTFGILHGIKKQSVFFSELHDSHSLHFW
jgi:hypothetical protein